MNKQRDKKTKSSQTVIGKKQDNMTGRYLGCGERVAEHQGKIGLGKGNSEVGDVEVG